MCGDAFPSSQHTGGGNKRIMSSRPSSVTFEASLGLMKPYEKKGDREGHPCEPTKYICVLGILKRETSLVTTSKLSHQLNTQLELSLVAVLEVSCSGICKSLHTYLNIYLKVMTRSFQEKRQPSPALPLSQ